MPGQFVRRKIAVSRTYPPEISSAVRDHVAHRVHPNLEDGTPFKLHHPDGRRDAQVGGDEVRDPLDFPVVHLRPHDLAIFANAHKKCPSPCVGEGRRVLQGPVGPLALEFQRFALLQVGLGHDYLLI